MCSWKSPFGELFLPSRSHWKEVNEEEDNDDMPDNFFSISLSPPLAASLRQWHEEEKWCFLFLVFPFQPINSLKAQRIVGEVMILMGCFISATAEFFRSSEIKSWSLATNNSQYKREKLALLRGAEMCCGRRQTPLGYINRKEIQTLFYVRLCRELEREKKIARKSRRDWFAFIFKQIMNIWVRAVAATTERGKK